MEQQSPELWVALPVVSSLLKAGGMRTACCSAPSAASLRSGSAPGCFGSWWRAHGSVALCGLQTQPQPAAGVALDSAGPGGGPVLDATIVIATVSIHLTQISSSPSFSFSPNHIIHHLHDRSSTFSQSVNLAPTLFVSCCCRDSIWSWRRCSVSWWLSWTRRSSSSRL